ncbi:Serpin-z4 [Thalictrum thalictroides]|uniref:Serpin-z4 n=1 Tax=Thalictrum thalictroides TaxID=46969 RepID=A0A7J6V7E4_THATH|nr:Serpin-z4 [Thalictrum thalictroides]
MTRDSVKTNTPFACLQITAELGLGDAKDKNFVFSPYSIQLGLGLVANGATGSTRREFLTFLDAENLNDLNSRDKQLVDKFSQTSENGPIVSFVGGIWVDQSSTLKPTFKQTAETIYKAMAESVDFQDEMKRKEVIDRVNKWTEEATRGLINSILPEDSVQATTSTVLANAIYFKGEWIDIFHKSYYSTFFLSDGSSIKEVPFMTNSSRQHVTTMEDFKILSLPYKKSRGVSMYIILPKKKDGLWSLLEKVGSDPKFLENNVPRDFESVEMRRLEIPKFKIAYGFEANEVLQALGLNAPFSDEAELDEMVSGGSRRKISKVRHKSHIEVNEKETEAAAVTEISDDEVGFSSFDDYIPPTVDFVANHPFMFMVRDDMTGVVLFMGHVVNPLLD